MSVNFVLRVVSISCLAATISAATASCRMYEAGSEAREPREIIREIENLVADGVVEVMLLGQNVNSYGKNLDQPITFAQLLEQIEQIEGLERIRFMTSHPKDLSDELIAVMAKSKKICRHLHLPLQSGSSRPVKNHESSL